MYRTPAELPNEHVLMYPTELAGLFLFSTNHIFNCIFPSSEAPGKNYVIVEEFDTSSQALL